MSHLRPPGFVEYVSAKIEFEHAWAGLIDTSNLPQPSIPLPPSRSFDALRPIAAFADAFSSSNPTDHSAGWEMLNRAFSIVNQRFSAGLNHLTRAAILGHPAAIRKANRILWNFQRLCEEDSSNVAAARILAVALTYTERDYYLVQILTCIAATSKYPPALRLASRMASEGRWLQNPQQAAHIALVSLANLGKRARPATTQGPQETSHPMKRARASD